MIPTKNPPRPAARAILGAAIVMIATQSSAHARLESTSPAAGATVAAPATIQVHFNEAIEVKLSSLKLTLADGTAIGAIAVNDTKNPATLSIKPNAALKPGAYKVAWSVVSDDGHKTHGTFDFTVQ